jgi:hypothetical protein
MRTIGRVEGQSERTEYSGGYIIQLTEDEANALIRLQEAMDGNGWTPGRGWMPERGGPSERNMDTIFKLIREWTLAKFEVNSLRRMVVELEGVLMKLEEKT